MIGAVLGVLLVLVAFVTWLLLRPSFARRLLTTTRVRDVNEKADIKISGVVQAERILLAPYTARECVYYRLEIAQTSVVSGLEVFSMEEGCDFRLKDDSDVAEVHVEGATFTVICDHVETERASRLSKRARRIAQDQGWKLPEIAQVMISEAIITNGECIEIVGQAVLVPSGKPALEAGGYRDPPAMMPVLSAQAVLSAEREPIWLESAQ